MDILPFHDCFRSPVTVETSELALVLLDGGGHAVGEVLPAVRDHVPGVGAVRVEDKPMVKGVSTNFSVIFTIFRENSFYRFSL